MNKNLKKFKKKRNTWKNGYASFKTQIFNTLSTPAVANKRPQELNFIHHTAPVCSSPDKSYLTKNIKIIKSLFIKSNEIPEHAEV